MQRVEIRQQYVKLSHSARDYQKHQYAASDVFNDVGEDNTSDIYKANKNQLVAGALCKNRRTKIHVNLMPK